MPDEIVPFKLPDELPTDRTELEALVAQADAAFEARYAQGANTAEDLAALREIAEQVRTIRAAVASDVEPEPEAEPEVAPEVEVPETPAEEEAPPAEDTAPSASSAVLDALLLSPAPAAPAPVPAVAAAPVAAAPVASPVPESIAASAEIAPDFHMSIAQPNPVTIVASADIPGIPSASTIDGLGGLVKAMNAKARALGDARGTSNGKGHPVASIMKPLSPDRNLDGLSERDQFARCEDLASPAFLLASGGWCAPSEQLYDLACEVEAPPEAVVLPTATTSRGGVKFPISPSFADFYALENNGLFTWTEADDISAADGSPTKPCFKIPCVSFDEARLELEGLCATAGNLTDLAYPELIRRYTSLLLTAHLHRMNAQKIAKMLAFVDDAVTMAGTFAAASALFDALSLQVQDLRDQFSMSSEATIEGMLPRWTRSLLKVDVARREQIALGTVSNGDVSSYLQAAGMSIQFVSDWQLMGDPDDPATKWPDEVLALLWLPGALRELTGPSLDITVARDSVLNETNDFTVAFTEESYQIYKPGCGVRSVTVPVCPNGAYGAPVELVCSELS